LRGRDDGGGLCRTAKLLRDVLLDYGHAVESLLPLLLVRLQVVFLEMRDVLGVREVLFLRVYRDRSTSERAPTDIDP